MFESAQVEMDNLEPIDFARHLRQASTSSEKPMAVAAQSRALRKRVSPPTSRLGIYTADLYCVEATLVVELDGSGHHTIEAKQRR